MTLPVELCSKKKKMSIWSTEQQINLGKGFWGGPKFWGQCMSPEPLNTWMEMVWLKKKKKCHPWGDVYLFVFLVSRSCSKCGWKLCPKSSSSSGLSPVLSPDSGIPSLRKSRLTCFQTSDYTTIHLFIFFSITVFLCFSSGKETAPVCAMSMAFPWMF